MKRIGVAAIGLCVGVALFMGGTQFGAHLWPGAETVVETKVEWRLPTEPERCDKLWQSLIDANTEYAARTARFQWAACQRGNAPESGELFPGIPTLPLPQR